MAVVDSFRALVESLDVASPEIGVLVAAGLVLADEIDQAVGDGKKSSASAVTALRALLVDLTAKGCAVVDVDEDWTAPTTVDLAAVRDSKKRAPADAGARGGGGGAKAG